MDADGMIVVTDLSSRNGTRQKRKKLCGTSVYEIGDNLYLGESVLSLHTVQADVAPAVKQDAAKKASRLFSSFTWVVIATLMAGASIAGVSYWASSEETTSESLTQGLLGFGIILMARCAIASFIGKMFRHKTYFKLHWIFACAIGVIGFILVLAFDVLRFNLDTETSNSIIQFAFTALLLAIVAYGTLSLSTRMSTGKKIQPYQHSGCLALCIRFMLNSVGRRSREVVSRCVSGTRWPTSVAVIQNTSNCG